MRLLLVVYRLFFFALYTSRIVAEVYWQRIVLRNDMRKVMHVRRRWARKVLHGVGVRVEVTGTPPDFPCLVLANHRSYLDPILLLRDLDAFPVAKAELASWPVIGKGAKWAGILYVKRERGESRAATLRAIAETITQQGHPVILFPEGTTSDLPGMLPVKRGAFRTAERYALPVVPVAIRYTDPKSYWVGEITFLQHAWQQFQQPRITVHIHYGPTLSHAGETPLEARVCEWIEGRLMPEPAVHNTSV
ncbi:MAG: 1-acyl-sn-glycerol-3-phosphate acyltransferase [Bacteroidetes bacterium]|nr:MAG: 1-acyl-sn-glycerol-3-phosphate acyltransferase [Bacteroidota bacterium]